MCSKGHIQVLYLSIIEKHKWSRLYYGQMNKYHLARGLYFFFFCLKWRYLTNSRQYNWNSLNWFCLTFSFFLHERQEVLERLWSTSVYQIKRTGFCRSLKKEAFLQLVVIKHWRIKWKKNCLVQMEIWNNRDNESATVSKVHLFLQSLPYCDLIFIVCPSRTFMGEDRDPGNLMDVIFWGVRF